MPGAPSSVLVPSSVEILRTARKCVISAPRHGYVAHVLIKGLAKQSKFLAGYYYYDDYYYYCHHALSYDFFGGYDYNYYSDYYYHCWDCC